MNAKDATDRRLSLVELIELSKAAQAELDKNEPMSFRRMAELIYDRDLGRCEVCGVDLRERYYECGHLVDRIAGGLDTPDNLVTMCGFCNRMKPVHDTLEDAWAWVNDGGAMKEILARVLARQESIN